MIRFIVALLCTTSLVVAASLFGLFLLPSAPTLWVVLSIVCGIIMLGLIITNLVFEARRRKSLQSMSERQRYDYSMYLKKEIGRDYSAAERRVWAAIVGGDLYIAAFVLLCILGIMFLGALHSKTIAGAIVYAILIMGLLVRLTKKNDDIKPENILCEQENPLLYAVARRARNTVGCRGEISFYLSDSLNIFETRDRFYIGISAVLYALFTSEELYAALLHEFGHVYNLDTRRSRRFFRVKTYGKERKV